MRWRQADMGPQHQRTGFKTADSNSLHATGPIVSEKELQPCPICILESKFKKCTAPKTYSRIILYCRCLYRLITLQIK